MRKVLPRPSAQKTWPRVIQNALQMLAWKGGEMGGGLHTEDGQGKSDTIIPPDLEA